MPRVLRVDPVHPESSAIAEAARVLAAGGLVAFPTETVYGLGARGLHPEDVAKIFVAKGRPSSHPLILHVDGIEAARSLSSAWPDRATRLAAAFWPGPLTIVVPRASHVPDEVTGGQGTVAVRAPANPIARALVRASGEPLAAPSANAHTQVSPTTAEHVVRSLGDRVDLVLDGGPCEHGIESTVVTSLEPPRVLRPGSITLAELRAIDPAFVYESITVEDSASRASPGLASKHYAPHARLILVDAGGESVARAFAGVALDVAEAGAIVWSEDAARAVPSGARLFTLPGDASAYARRLFAVLHEVDAAKLEIVVVEGVPDSPEFWAVRDRLARAAKRS